MSSRISSISKPALLLTFFCLSIFSLYGQSKELANIVKNLSAYSSQTPQEKVYLHTDRAYYGQGESIWFQAYLTSGWLNQFSPLSTTIYVQLLSKDLQLVEQQVIKANGGFGNGVLDLSDSLPSGDYELVAFTNWMKNFDNDFFFRKQISVVDGQLQESVVSDGEVDLQFFPEGGSLLADIPTKVAFKAIDKNGLGKYIKGTIQNSSGEIVATLETAHDGMGSFFITPEPDQKYTCVMTNTEQTVLLPTVESSGGALRLTRVNDDLVKVAVLTSNLDVSNDAFSLVVHSRGMPTFYADLNLKGPASFINVSLNGMPGGIAHFTLFDGNSQPVSERLLFVEAENRKVELKADKESYKKREKVSLTVALDAINDSTQAVFSMSAVDLGQVVDKELQSTIYTDLLLTSDIKGTVTNPAYYFNEKNEQRNEHLDLVMLTHGWTRFNWEQVVNGDKKEVTELVERGISVTGRVVKDLSKKPESNAKVTLISLQDSIPLIEETKASKDGVFEFVDLDIYDDEEIVIKGEKAKKRRNYLTIQLDSTYFFPEIYQRKSSASDVQLAIELDEYYRDKQRRDQIDAAYSFDTTVTILEGVVVEADKKTFDEQEALRTIWGKGSDVVDFEQVGNPTQNVWSNLIGKIPGVTIIGPNNFDGPTVLIRQAGIQNIPPMIMLDDVPVEANILSGFTSDQIQKVVVFKGLSSSALFGSDGIGGVLAFYTKTALGLPISSRKPIRENGTYTTKIYNSYKAPREFYAPRYDVKRPEHVKFDSRILLHWEPDIILSDNNEAKVEFWTSDEETTIMINVQGLSTDGQPYSETIYLETGKR